MLDHVKEVHISSQDKSCIVCNKKFDTEILTNSHLETAHKVFSTSEPKSTSNFDSSVPNAGIFCCNYCDYSTSKKSNVDRHEKSKHQPLSSVPGKDTPSAQIKSKEKAIPKSTPAQDKGGKPVKDTVEDLDSQDSVGTSEVKRFSCPNCEKSYTHNRDLTRHIKSVHSKMSYPCEECSARFSYIGDLARHINDIHTKEKIIYCPECDEPFTQSANLNRHISDVHSKLKKFSCPQCDESFAQKGHLNRHTSDVHSKQNKFPCPQCDESFAQK